MSGDRCQATKDIFHFVDGDDQILNPVFLNPLGFTLSELMSLLPNRFNLLSSLSFLNCLKSWNRWLDFLGGWIWKLLDFLFNLPTGLAST